MSTLFSIKKKNLRLTLAVIAAVVPIDLLLTQWLSGSESILLESISLYYFSNAKWIFIVHICLFGLVSIFYGMVYSRDRIALVACGICSICMVLFPTFSAEEMTKPLSGYLHWFSLIVFLALLGWLIRSTFNLPLPYPLMTRIGMYIWITLGILVIYFLFLRDLWPPLIFVLETATLWLFTFGIYVRNQIDHRLSIGK